MTKQKSTKRPSDLKDARIVEITKHQNKGTLIEQPENVRKTKEVGSPKLLWGGKKGRLSWKMRFIERWNLKRKPTRSYLITMLFGNGTKRTFSIVADADQVTFIFNKKQYQLVYEEAWYDISMSNYHLFYHEHYPSPLQREIIIDEGGENEAFFRVSPETLRELTDMKIIKAMVTPESVVPKWVWITLGIVAIVLIFVLSRGGK